MKKTFELKSTLQKSYYNKAKVIERDGETFLQSYETEVCKINASGDFVKLWNGYSNTTMKHINDFRRLFGFAPINKKAWDALPCDNGEKYKIEFSNGFVSWMPSTTFDNEDTAWEYAEKVAENNGYRVSGSVITCF